MGGGVYNSVTRDIRATTVGYYTKSATEIFSERTINNAMDPNGVDIRESRDSEEHPNSFAVILGLDETGSMGSIPHYLVKHGLPTIMDKIIKGGEKDIQVLFLGIGDHECGDTAPLQVGQFESSDELLDHWLTKLYIEGGGGANYGESYLLAWYFAAKHTSIDCFEKRGRKGILFTIGDEPCLPSINKSDLKRIMGRGEYPNISSSLELLDAAREKYEVFHIHVRQGSNGMRQDVVDGWKQLLGDHLLIAERKEEIADIISSKVLEYRVTDEQLWKTTTITPAAEESQEIYL